MKERDFDYDEVRKLIRESSPDSSIYIGTDSKVYSHKGEQWVAYVTVIIVHASSSKGARILKALRTERFYGQMRQRLMTEVTDAITAGMEIVDDIGDRAFEIHLDINRDKVHKSSVLVKEATGYVLGTFGFEPKLKPESFAASSVADRFAVSNAKYRADTPAAKRRFARFKRKEARRRA